LRAKAASVYSLGHYAESIEVWEEARRIYVVNGLDSDAANVQRSMVDALMYLGRYDEALDLGAQAHETFTKYQDTVALARLETNVGNVYHRLDRNAEALECYQRALVAFRAQGDSFAIALTSYNSANIHCNLHEFAAARSCYQLAEDLYRQKGMDLAAAQARYSLGYLDFMTGRYHQAMRTLHEAEVEFDRLGDTRMRALCLLDLAEICLQLNVLQEAADLATRARDRFQELRLRYEEAKAILFRGLAYAGLSRLDEAETLLAEAEDIFRAEGNSLYIGLSVVYRAELELHRGSPQRALEIIDEARSAFERPDLGAKQIQAKLIEARALRAMGCRDAALKECCTIAEALARIDALWLETEMHELFGDLVLDDGDRSAAYEHYLAAIHLIEQRRATIRVDDFRTAFMRHKLRVYEKLIHLCLDENKAEHNALAFYYVESRKARTLVDMMTNDLDLWPASAETNQELKGEWTRLREELHWLHHKLLDDSTSNSGRPPQQTDSRLVATSGNLASRIKAKEDELARLLLKAQAVDPDFAALENSEGLTVDDLRRVLGPNDLLIEYYADGTNLAAFLIDHTATDVVRLPCVLSEVRERMLELKFLLEKFQYGAAYVRGHERSLLTWANESMRWFYDALLRPFSERLTGKELVIVPFDVLHGLPFHALYDGDAYLIDRCEIACAPSARLYAMCRRRNVQARSRIAVFGVPDQLAPQIESEVQNIVRCFPQSQSFVGDRATSDELTRAAASSDILHIASHAVFRQDNPMFSGFKLFDQWMNAYDVASLRMNSTLITLSGCSTGAGRVYAGDETIGLVRSFLKAGAASLVVSLWPVNDPSAAALMGKFYEELGHGTPSRAALRRAILDSKLHHANPYYWAPFVLIGQD
jgi:CHAT domain-containing protein